MPLRLLKLTISVAVFLCDILSRQWNKLLGRPVPGTCVLITYHTITPATRAGFAMQMAKLKRVARVIPSLATQMLELGYQYVGITFDDAFRSFAQNALPVLANVGLPVILFVPTGYLGRKSAWFDYGGPNQVGEEVVSALELKQLTRQYQIEIGSHSVNHPNLVEISNEDLRAELRDSKEALELLLQRKINSISFPYGSYGERELQLAREIGYDFCLGGAPQMLVGSVQPGVIGRVSVDPSDWNLEFKLKVLGAYRWQARASAWKRKLKGRASPAALMLDEHNA